MDPDKFQMRDIKRRLLRLEKKFGYMKDDRKADLTAFRQQVINDLDLVRTEIGVLFDEVYAVISARHPPAPTVKVEGSLAARRRPSE